MYICINGVAESGDDFTQFSTIYQWFQKLIHPALMQRRINYSVFHSIFDIFLFSIASYRS
ncbi:MAG: hypothetical protein HRU34_18985 [Richelia sp.]|nr:hypothetical protein [Richelia sp.]